ncbi:MAG: T9SS type A sorting domain-containing protein [Candidatus Kapabacteria bacterium]|nr:T9SS type A sorting domain-containing protein [Candidatus Kapabacteria bacterium]
MPILAAGCVALLPRTMAEGFSTPFINRTIRGHAVTRTLGLLLFVAIVLSSLTAAQPFVPGNTYYGTDNFMEYQPGNIPLIISVPHGGHLEPAELPNRDCQDCVYGIDSYTQELARKIRDAFVQQTGCYPHIVYNLLHRKKLDMNRDVLDATDTNDAVAPYWNDYHDFIAAAKNDVMTHYGKGLFIDLHGHGHTKQRIEYGYILRGSYLREPDSVINTTKRVAASSIRNLASSNLSGLTHAQLVRGATALGTLFANRGYPGVPSMQDPYPDTADAYFNGGYNTFTHGSYSGGAIDAIQMELYTSIRRDTAERAVFADAFASILRSYLQEHYLENFAQQSCLESSVPNPTQSETLVAPNPAAEFITVGTINDAGTSFWLRIIDVLGQVRKTNPSVVLPTQLDVSALTPGTYYLQLIAPSGYPVLNQSVVIVR